MLFRSEARPRALIQMATGAGKTAVATRVVGTFDLPSIFLVHRKELLDQTALAYQRDGLEFGLISPDYDFRPASHLIASIDTLIARRSRFEGFMKSARLLVFDEAHHAVAQKWRTVRALAPNSMLLGPSATPWRTNGEGLGDFFDDVAMAPSMKALIEMVQGAAKELVAGNPALISTRYVFCRSAFDGLGMPASLSKWPIFAMLNGKPIDLTRSN